MEICDLNDDLLDNILVRLPVECVGQLKCVSKSFNALISSPKFIKFHLNHALLNVQLNKPNILVPGKTKIKLLEISINNDNRDFEGFNSEVIHSHRELQDDLVIKKVVGSSNGLLCLLLSSDDDEQCEICRSSGENFCFHDDVFALCNPLIKSSWDLPGNQWKKLFRSNISLYGFWYDDVNDDYKVVVMNRCNKEEETYSLDYECEVYSLRSNSWSQVRCSLLDDLSYQYRYPESKDGFFFESALHWIIYTVNRETYISIPKFILALDDRTYKPKILPLPKGISCGVWELTMLNDCLALSNPTDVLWVMKDYAVSNSWMSITIRKDKSRFWYSSFTPLAFIQERLLVSYEAFGNDVVLHDTVSGHVERFKIKFKKPSGFDGNLQLKQLHFVGSLVQPYPPSVVVAYKNLIISEEHDGLENFDKFHIHVMGGAPIDSELPEDVRRKYYELCCSKRSYLHKGWVPAVNSRVAARMVTKVVEIADSTRSSTFTFGNFNRWDELLRSFEMLGMDVGFLRDRISSLLRSFF